MIESYDELLRRVNALGFMNPEAVAALAKIGAAFTLTPVGASMAGSGGSRIGGVPDIDAPSWPLDDRSGARIPFFCQLDFSECGPLLDPADQWPTSGVLCLFNNFDDTFAPFRAVYREHPTSCGPAEITLPEHTITAESVWTLPYHQTEAAWSALTADDSDAWAELWRRLWRPAGWNRSDLIGGHVVDPWEWFDLTARGLTDTRSVLSYQAGSVPDIPSGDDQMISVVTSLASIADRSFRKTSLEIGQT